MGREFVWARAGNLRLPPSRRSGADPFKLADQVRAFGTTVNSAKVLHGKNVVVIDDVLTTGATANACCKALLRGGAEAVSIITLARVVRPLSVSI